MLTISRPAAKACLAVFRRLTGRRTRSGDPAVTLAAGPSGVGLRCATDEVLVAYHDAAGRGTGEVTVPLSALDLAAAGKGEATFTLESRLVAVSSGGRRTTVDAPDKPVRPVPVAAGTPSPNPPGLIVALAAASAAAGESGDSRFALHRLRLRTGKGEIAATNGSALLVQSGWSFPGSGDALVPATPLFASPEFRDLAPVAVFRAEGQVVVTAGPWTVALRVDAAGRFPDVESVIPDLARAGTKVELTEAGLAVLRDRVPGLPVDEDRHRSVVLDLSPSGIVVAAGGDRVLVPGTVKGPAVRLACDRVYLARMAALGLKRLAVTGPNKPVVAHDDMRRLVWMTLEPPAPEAAPMAAVPAAEPRKLEAPRPREAEPERVIRLPARLPEKAGPEDLADARSGRGWGLLRPLVDRVKSALATRAAEEIEADAAVDAAGRRAGLWKLAERYEAGGLTAVAADLRRRATGPVKNGDDVRTGFRKGPARRRVA